MKKLLSIFAVAAVLFGFASCSGDLHDMAAPDALYIVGDMAAAHTAMEKNGSSFTYTLTYANNMNAWGGGAGTANFKFTFTPDWSSATSLGNDEDTAPAIAATADDAEEFVLTEGGNPGNITVDGFVAGEEYTFTVTVDATGKYTVTIVGTVDNGLQEFADVSAIDASTVVQEGAYLKFEGSSCALFDGLKIYFNGTTTAVAYVVADKDYDFSNWGMDHFAAWFKFYAGQGVALRQASKQFGAGSTTMGTAYTIDQSGATNNLEITDMTVSENDVFKVTVDASSDATIMIEKL